VTKISGSNWSDRNGLVRGMLGTRDDTNDGGFREAYLELASPDATLYCERDTAALDFLGGGNSLAYLGTSREGLAKLTLAEGDGDAAHRAGQHVAQPGSLGFDSRTLRRIGRRCGCSAQSLRTNPSGPRPSRLAPALTRRGRHGTSTKSGIPADP
jgi:hypothetical protein